MTMDAQAGLRIKVLADFMRLEDTILIERRGASEIYYSKSERVVFVQTADCHPGTLKLTVHNLRHFAEIAAQKTALCVSMILYNAI